MNVQKQIQFDVAGLDELLSNLHGFWIRVAQTGNMNREEFYRAYLVKKFYEKTRKRHDNMISEGRKSIKVKFDLAHAVLMVDVLQRTQANRTTMNVLHELGSMCPTQMTVIK